MMSNKQIMKIAWLQIKNSLIHLGILIAILAACFIFHLGLIGLISLFVSYQIGNTAYSTLIKKRKFEPHKLVKSIAMTMGILLIIFYGYSYSMKWGFLGFAIYMAVFAVYWLIRNRKRVKEARQMFDRIIWGATREEMLKAGKKGPVATEPDSQENAETAQGYDALI